MKKLACTLALSLSAVAAFAGPAPAKPEGVARETGPALELKNKSSFVIEEGSRNPFWPIGWKPQARRSSSTTEAVGPEISPNSFLVSSITVDTGGKYAIINGKVMNEGQVFGLQLGSQTYQITVKAIQDGQVILLRRDQEIIAPLRRR